MKKRLTTTTPNLRVNTSVSLSKTKPAKERRLQRIQKSISRSSTNATSTQTATQSKSPSRVKPDSHIEQTARHSLWLIPARMAYFINGLYYLSFSVMAFIGVFSSYKLIKPFFTLPFDTSFSSFFLLEIAAVFALLACLLFFHAACKPRHYRWFFFLILIVFTPYHLIANLQKMQIELPQDFQNYLYFDTIVTAVLWVMYMLSIYPYLKPATSKK